MRRRHEVEAGDTTSVNLTPLIDMVFILLIFFLVTASFTKETGIEINRPTAVGAVRQEQASLLIGIDAAGHVWMDQRKVALPDLRAEVTRLHSQNPEGTVVITADRAAPSGLLVRVIDQARQAGVRNIAVAATRE